MKSDAENEIMELQYMGQISIFSPPKKATKNNDQSMDDLEAKAYRQFLVRRRTSLEIMLTNGIIFWTE